MHANQLDMLYEHQFERGRRRHVRSKRTIRQHKVSLHSLDAKIVIISHLDRAMLRIGNLGNLLGNAIVLKLHGEQSHTTTHAILEDELRIEIEHQAVALMKGGIHRNIEAYRIKRLGGRKHHGWCLIPHVGSIARGRKIIKLAGVRITTQGYNLVVQAVAQFLIYILQQFGVAHVIHHRTVEFSRGNVVLSEHRLAIRDALSSIPSISRMRH